MKIHFFGPGLFMLLSALLISVFIQAVEIIFQRSSAPGLLLGACFE
jgi:hypothetical protein